MLQQPRHKRQFTPGLECLEDRCTPAVSISVWRNTLQILGDNTANTVTLSDDGNGTLTASITGTGSSATRTVSGITNVLVSTRGGSDTVNYTLTSAGVRTLNLAIDLGAREDDASAINTVTLDHAKGVSSRALNVDVLGTRGKELVTTTLGTITDTHVVFAAALGSGDDSYDLTLAGNILGKAYLHTAIFGGAGNDTLGVHQATNTDVTVAKDALLDIWLEGGAGTDTLTTTYKGQMLGRAYFTSDGGDGTDTIATNVTLNSGSTGRVDARVLGGKGADKLTLNVTDNSGTPSTLGKLTAVLDGGNDKDTDVWTATANVTLKRLP